MNIYEVFKNYYSDSYQVNKMIEELGELSSAAAMLQNDNNEENLEHLIHEMADVEVTMEHIRHRFNTQEREDECKNMIISKLYNEVIGVTKKRKNKE